MTILKTFFKALNDEESKIIPVLASDKIGWIVRCAINELDWYYYNYAQAKDPTNEDKERLYILQIGTARLIKLALESRESFDAPVLTFRRQAELTEKSLSIASALGIIQHGRRVAQTISIGIGAIQEINSKEFDITLPEEIEDDEFYERSLREHYFWESRRMFKEITSIDKWQEMENKVDEKLKELVYPFMEHFIGYESDPILDEYFFALASYEVSLQEGYDTYHYKLKFGGIKFQHYMLALKFMVSSSIRHIRCANILVEKHPEIRLEDILTISADVKSYIESLRDAVNYFGAAYEDFSEINLEQATQIFDVLTYSRANLNLIDAPGSPYPIFVKNSETGLIKGLFGAKSEPVRYLLESLRFHFPKDFDKNQASRETAFQRACVRVLNNTYSGLEYRENVKFRLNGQVLSDIDLVVLQKSTGTILLIQLKHQELYGSDIHAKSTRNARLNKQIQSWMSAVNKWKDHVGSKGVRETLGIKGSEWPQDLNIYRIALSRHFVHSLKSMVFEEDTAFANWPQFYNSNQIVQRDCSEPTLDDLVATLRMHQYQPEMVTHLEEPTTQWIIGDLKFKTSQCRE
ncbi:hypothetical protein VXI04_004480 [Vibrio vulnificus]|uniref:hypothetical protein n=1 Tax=Vibrio vulnificus TaxID=672 RepID=UPI00102A4E70|nr:hypothetical protein [Vibrio vulnificus]EHK9186206.1 hypothetical protein [Vibrio vulnificus]EHZ2756298.1 hypothetical protein [Vibrio vulnificus]EHZ2765414.1 hypothetical protein [Vibrio vulnificus]EIX4876254.1 hypothetical protein [Vibrio vulnificus]EKD8805180.1 hypothetical protein [Vibrio vulnificus]